MRFILSLIFCTFATIAMAAPQTYAVDAANTDVGFTYTFANNPINGTFPDHNIDLSIDFNAVQNSTVNVTLNTQTAKGGFVFGTNAMRSKRLLNAAKFPKITFKSTSVTGGGDTAIINGMVTIRGITKPLTLNAKLFRPRGTEPTDLKILIMRITGTIDRFAFGADGFENEVGADLSININATILKQ